MGADNTIVLTTTTITVKLHADNDSFCLLLVFSYGFCFVDYNHARHFNPASVCELR